MDMNIRPRRLRNGVQLRKMVRETRMDKSSLIYPMFVKEGTGMRVEIPSMAGQYRDGGVGVPDGRGGGLEEGGGGWGGVQ